MTDLVAIYALKAQFEAETMFVSSLDTMVDSAAMKEIIAMGNTVVPLIIKELRDEPNFLYLALPRITGENPVSEAMRGKIDEISNAWIAWATNSGLE